MSPAPPILVLGRSGQLAKGLMRRLGDDGLALGRAQFDLADPQSDIRQLLQTHNPRAVINAAAYTAVDRAETEPDACRALNRDAVLRLAQACAAQGAPLVHISTDYVFNGQKGAPYAERDAVDPLNIYGRTKAEGELALTGAMLPYPAARWSILRTSWVFDANGSGFLQTMLRLGQTRERLSIVADQRGCPTGVDSLVDAVLITAERLAQGDQRFQGILHVAGADDASWVEFAAQIFAEAGLAVQIDPTTAEAYAAPATRPADSRLDSSYIQSISSWRPRPWREQLKLEFDKMGR